LLARATKWDALSASSLTYCANAICFLGCEKREKHGYRYSLPGLGTGSIAWAFMAVASVA
jgi:hypothetical protein